MTGFAGVDSLLTEAVSTGVAPAAVLEVGRAAESVHRAAFGRLTYDAESANANDDTVFDLASLTKVISTATLAMRAVDAGVMRLGDPVRQHLAAWRGIDRESVTLRDLLAHCSGLTAYLPFFQDYR